MKSVGSKLSKFLREYPVIPFDWKTHNCAHFAHDWYFFLAQKECAKELPQCADQAETRKLFVRMNASLESLVTDISGMQQIAPQYASVGDIVLFQSPTHDLQVLGICNGTCCAFMSTDGTIQFAAVTITAAWRVTSAR